MVETYAAKVHERYTTRPEHARDLVLHAEVGAHARVAEADHGVKAFFGQAQMKRIRLDQVSARPESLTGHLQRCRRQIQANNPASRCFQKLYGPAPAAAEVQDQRPPARVSLQLQ